MASTTTYAQIGIREDLSDSIWDITPEDTPFASNCKRVSVDNTFFEWQTDSLAAVSATTAVEGADATFAAAAATTRVGNRTEIIEKTASTSGTLEATDRAGRQREMAYQVIKRGKEIKRDLEHHLVGVSQIAVTGSASVARKTASYVTWTLTNDVGTAGAAGANRGTSGTGPVDGDGTDAPADGTQRAFTEAMLGGVIDAMYNNGGIPNIIMAGTFNKRAITGFSGNSDEVKHNNTDKKVINAVSLYVSDYGELKVVPNRFSRSRDVLVYQQDMWCLGVLRGMQNKEIAATGDAEKRQVLQECGLISKNEASSGGVYDLTTA